MTRSAWILFLATLVICAAYLAWAAGQLPDRVASHFGADGAADQWMSRTGFLVTFGATVGLSALVFASIAWWMPRMPDRWFNLPRRQAWLAPERRQRTIADITARLLRLGAATNLFFLGLAHTTLVANRSATEVPRLPAGFWVLFGVYMVLVAVWTVRFVRRFGRGPDEAS
jgi:hypothetical protein